MSLPYYFQPFTCPETGHSFCDGGVLSNYPLRFLSDKDLRETLGIQIITTHEHIEELDIQGILLRPLRLLMAEHHVLERQGYERQTLTIYMESVNMMDLNISIEEKKGLVKKGEEAALHFAKARPTPVRRYSVS
jgi:predicted acylesterase/phospholipase RssA